MNKSHSAHLPALPDPEGGPVRPWVRFWFAPADPVGLHVLRLLAGLLFLSWLLPLVGDASGLFGLQGWFDETAHAEVDRLAQYPFNKPVSWSVLYLAGSDPRLLAAVYWLSVAVLALFALGVLPRVTAILTWVVVASFTAHPVIDADADVLLLLLSLYLMVGYLLLGPWDVRGSLVRWLLGPAAVWPLGRTSQGDSAEAPTSVGANVALRLVQVHLAVVLVTSGLHKLQFPEWWAGGALWYSLYPPFATKLKEVREMAPDREVVMGWLSLAAYAVLAWQIGFPLFAWRRRFRLVLFGGAVLGALGTVLLYRMPVFGPALFVACLSFVSPEAWHRLLGGLSRLPGLGRLAQAPSAAAAELRLRTETASLVTRGQYG